MLDKPFDLRFLENLELRHYLDKELQRALSNYRIGYIGECEFLLILLPEVPKGWEVLVDMNFPVSAGRMQVDVILIAPDKVHHFEVKNLTVDYIYENGRWFSNGWELENNFFIQMERAQSKLLGNLRKLGVFVPIESKLILINESDTVKFIDNTQEGRYLKRWQLKSYLKKIVSESKTTPPNINPKEVAEGLLQFTRPAHENITVKGTDLVPNIRKGILCESCGNHNILIDRRYHIDCPKCGTSESKQRAILRTICEYGLLHYKESLVRSEVIKFIRVKSLNKNVGQVLKKYFTKISKSETTEYVNPVNSFEYVYKDIKFRYRSDKSVEKDR